MATSEVQHAELIERINQLNILRESNATLRSDCEAYAKRSRELDAQLQRLTAELDPAKERARVAQAELQARDSQIKALEEENRRWQERNTQILTKVGSTLLPIRMKLIGANLVRPHRPCRISSDERRNRATSVRECGLTTGGDRAR